MKIAVTAQGSTLESPVEPRFGRCSHLLVVDSVDMGVEVLPNPYADEPGGAGTRLVSIIADRDVEVVLTGSPGPNASVLLETAGIRVVHGCSGTVRRALTAFVRDEPED
ncbi:MAG: NifB/NifX family molybdenum-iron cluster-binding protein [Gemmatimonadota bacterium]|jgi:predicted Fe-Mo cluster-binding NifX family protein